MTPSELTAAIDLIVGNNPRDLEPSIETALAYENVIDVLGEEVVIAIWGYDTLRAMEEIIATYLEPEPPPTCEEE